MKEKVSVIVPCYNQGKYIEECIESIENQTYKNIEIVIVNDGSTDNSTIQIINKLELKNIYKIINIKNAGLANARNVGIKNSTGKYILPLDADDKIGKEYVEKCVDMIEQGKGDIIYCICKRFGENNKLLYLKEFSIETILQTNVVFCSAMFKREDYDKTNGYNINMKYGFEDWDFWLTMIENNKTFYRINEILFYYRIKENSMYSNITREKENYNKSILQIRKNHIKLYSKYEECLNKENKGFGLIKRKIRTVFEIGKMILLAYIN